MVKRDLGPQQVRVLLLAAWLTNEQIGDHLGIGECTVRSRLNRLYKVLRVPDMPHSGDKRLAAVVVALREGLITLEDLWEASHIVHLVKEVDHDSG